MGDTEVWDAKYKELESTCMPVMMKISQGDPSGGGMPGGMPDMSGMGGMAVWALLEVSSPRLMEVPASRRSIKSGYELWSAHHLMAAFLMNTPGRVEKNNTLSK